MGFDLPVMNRLRRSGQALSPASLFSTGAQGVIYDPRDLSTMFQDSLGTTPVTAPGQVVGLRLDKSKGGPGPELVSNGDFSGGTTGWTNASIGTGTFSASSGVATIVGVDAANRGGLVQGATCVVGRTYRVTMTVSGASVNFALGSTTSLDTAGGAGITASGAASFVVVATATTMYVKAWSIAAGGTATLDNISVRELAGNHAIQATAGARLTYGIEPKTGTRNLFLYSEQFDNAYWSVFRCTISANSIAAPDGTLTADKTVQTAGQTSIGLVATQGASVFTAPASSPIVLSVYAKAAEKTFLAFGTDGLGTPFGINSYAFFNLSSGTIGTVPAGLTAAISSVGNGWFRCSISLTTRASSGTVSSILGGADADNNFTVVDNGGIHLWGAHAEFGSVITPYQKVVTAFEVTEAGVPTCHYCAYAGANSMATGSIDFTTTNKVSVFVGVRKLSDAATAHLVSLEPTTGPPAVFVLLAPSASGANSYRFSSTGSAPTYAGAGTGVFAASPNVSVLTGTADIAGPSSTLRRNGVLVETSTTTQGDGNYSNRPISIGRRAGTDLPFTGRDYGIVVVGKAASAAEINITEAWLAANTPTVVL
jgi:hypothetical protein